jgi:hypothetical protein
MYTLLDPLTPAHATCQVAREAGSSLRHQQIPLPHLARVKTLLILPVCSTLPFSPWSGLEPPAAYRHSSR